MYIYERPNWPNFTWDHEQVYQALLPVKFEQGRLLGQMKNLGFELQKSAVLEALTSEVVKTSEIEGEVLNVSEVRSSVARHLGLEAGGLLPADRHVDGIVEMLLDATRNYNKPLTQERLCHWHALLFPTGMMLVNAGVLRRDNEGPMQVVSGHYGREKVHFTAPPAKNISQETKKFLQWFNQQQKNLDPIVKAAIAHLWFVTLHPFEDGNGRISRAIADMALALAEQQANRFYSMSTEIRKQRKSYYEILERTQKSRLDISEWLVWFLNCLHQSILQSDSLLKNILNKAKFWEQHADKSLNERQITMLNFLFDGFKGKLTSSKWAKMIKCSQDTAARDIKYLLNQEILVKSAEGGRSTSYLLKDYPINFID